MNPNCNVIYFDGEEVMPTPEMFLPQSKRNPTDKRRNLSPMLEDAMAQAIPLLRPAAVWALKPLGATDCEIPSGVSKDVYSRLTLHFGVVCTIGDQLEDCSRDYFEKQQFTLGYLLDQIGTFAVSLLSQKTASLLCKEYGAIRWAPGDQPEDQSLQTQRDLFTWVPAEQIGVHLTTQNVMLPVKSLSYHLYAGPELHEIECQINCSHCVWNGACDRQ